MTITKCDACGKEIQEGQNVKVKIEAQSSVYLDELKTDAEYDMCRECAEDLKEIIKSMRSV